MSLIWYNFSVLCGKSSDYLDADIYRLCISVYLLHPVRCPVKRGRHNRDPNGKRMHAGLNLCVFSEIYESEMRDMQVDGSLPFYQKLVYVDACNPQLQSFCFWENEPTMQLGFKVSFVATLGKVI